MKDTYTASQAFTIRMYKRLTVLTPAVAAVAAIVFTVARLLGYYADTPVGAVVLFDVITVWYFVIAIFLRKASIETETGINRRLVFYSKIILLVLVLLQWNLISYLFPSRDFWGFAPLFLMFSVFFFDRILILWQIGGLSVSILVSWIVYGEYLLPEPGPGFVENLMLRFFALGLTFFFLYLYGRYTQKLLREVTEYAEYLKNLSERIREEGNAGSVTDTKTWDGRHLLKDLRILVVDDNALSRQLSRELLEDENAIISEAASGFEAIRLVKNGEEYDVILMDIVMAGMNGIETVRAIRRLEQGAESSIPIIGLSGEGSPELISELQEAGASGYMDKPLSITKLLGIMVGLMKEQSFVTSEKLKTALQEADRDALTRVRSASAYTAKVEELNLRIREGKGVRFAVVMCDINGLKAINDTQGHIIGDIFVQNCSGYLSEVYGRKNVYRIGGDEFAVILEGRSYENRRRLYKDLMKKIEEAEEIQTVTNGKASFAAGMSEFRQGRDRGYLDVMNRADVEMYAHKRGGR